MKKGLALLLCLLILAGTAGCAVEGPTPARETETNGPEQWNTIPAGKVSSEMSATDFDGRFLDYIASRTDGNYMVSPLSFRYALGLLLAGAKGETKTELLKALGVESAEEWDEYCANFNGFVKWFDENLKSEIKDFNEEKAKGWLPDSATAPFRALRVANSIWKKESIPEDFTETYKALVAANYAAEHLSFSPENVVERVNSWVSDKTEKMIKVLLPENYDASSLSIILMNALYFKDSWRTPFEKANTVKDDFTTKDGKKVEKDFMRQTDHYRYYKDDKTEAVILEMNGGIYMAFAIGDTKDIGKAIENASSRRVSLKIPKIDLETSFSDGELKDFLIGAGVKEAFTEDADFSGMIERDILVDDIIQKTRLKLDEEGVEAAAVTAIMMAEGAYMEPEDPVEFNADVPFSFYIYTTCNDSTALLFAGEIVE